MFILDTVVYFQRSRFYLLKLKTAIILCLIVATIAAYWQIAGNGFINFDDPEYLYANPHVLKGLTPENLVWALSATDYSNWHPLTWLVHMLNYQLFGLNPSGHHLVSLGLHTANVVVLFLLLRRMTGALWRSAAVAALFALHPLHVESVAWAAELKDLLSTFCGFLCLYAYVRYSESPQTGRYLPVLLLLALGLMAKPMLVTLPLVMLLLDYWPLQRFGKNNGGANECSVWRIVQEKIPLVCLSSVSCLITFYAQQKGLAIRSLTETTLLARIANALTSYAAYLGKTFWPLDLAVLYPFPPEVHVWRGLLAALLLVAISFVTFRTRKSCPYIIVGWLWFLGTLAPVIGIVRVGMQSMADRYMYFPLTGILIMVVWGVSEAASDLRWRQAFLALATATALSLSAAVTWRQSAYWQSNSTLYRRTLAVTGDNFIIENNLGFALDGEGRFAEATDHYHEALRIAPWYARSLLNMGVTLRKQGKVDEAVKYLQSALVQQPDNAAAYNELGVAMLQKGELDDAVTNLQLAVRFDPGLADAYYNLGLTFARAGNSVAAVDCYSRSLQLKPDDFDGHYNLGIEYARQQRYDEAIRHFNRVLALNPDRELYLLAQQGIEKALRLKAR